MKTTNFNTWFEVQKVTNKNYSKEQFDSMRDVLEECWNYSKESVIEDKFLLDNNTDCDYNDVTEMQDRIDELESALEEIHSLSEVW